MTARVVVVGGGGREHALAARLAEDPEPRDLVVIPGNDGIASRFRCVAAGGDGVESLERACAEAAPDLVVVGPEQPLADGLTDRLAARGIAVFGPSRAAARIESSKGFAKELMLAAGVPTAEARSFDIARDAIAALGEFGPPWVIKADGLAAGKGVLVTSDTQAAREYVEACMSGGRLGEAGRRVLLERHLEGEEVSVMAVCDGVRAVLLPAARDYKRAGDGDAGPNTGGMGAVAPSETIDAAGEAFVLERVVRPVLAELARRGAPFRGVLYAGLMRTAQGLQVIEFNARFGDPEAQVILPLVGGSLYDLLASAAAGRLEPAHVPRVPGAAVTVALADRGYPESHSGAARLEGAEVAGRMPGVSMRYAGVRRDGDAYRFTGGRGAYVCAAGVTRAEARARAYAAIGRLSGSGWRCRGDIGHVAAHASS